MFQTVEPRRALAWRPVNDPEVQLFELGFGVLASSTRYAMLAPLPVEHLPRWLRAPSLHISQASLDALNGLHALQKFLVGLRILDDDLGFPIDRQDQRVAGFLEA